MEPGNTLGTSDMQKDSMAQINAAVASACADGTFVHHPWKSSGGAGIESSEAANPQRMTGYTKDSFRAALLAQKPVLEARKAHFM